MRHGTSVTTPPAAAPEGGGRFSFENDRRSDAVRHGPTAELRVVSTFDHAESVKVFAFKPSPFRAPTGGRRAAAER